MRARYKNRYVLDYFKMTKALQAAFEAIAKLPENQQNALASAILQELAVEERWEAALQSDLEALERLADEAISDDKAGRTQKLEPEKL
jgi:hypothetical protein